MKFILFSILDGKAGVFLQPFVARSDVDAKRQLSAAFKDPQFMQTPAGAYPQDFALYELGQFDDEFGTISASPKPTRVCELSALKPADSPAQFSS